MKAQQTSQEWQGIEEEDSWRDRMPLGCSGRAGGGGVLARGGVCGQAGDLQIRSIDLWALVRV